MNLPREPGCDDDGQVLVNPYRVAEDCLVATCPGGWEKAAWWYSTLAGGQWHFSPIGLTWRNGNRTLWVRDACAMADVLQARQVCLDLDVPGGWSVGRCARNLLTWIGEPQRFAYRLDYIHDEAGTGFRCLTPGRYDDVIVWDAKAYYYTMWCRLPSLRCSPGTDGTITWHAMPRDEVARRRAMEARIGGVKGLRNGLWGAALGSSQWRYFYHRGERKPFPPKRGPFHASALCLARSAWELCRDAAEEVSSVYSHTDCVTSVGGQFPSVWEDAGYPVAVKHAGPATFNHLMSFKIAGQASRYFEEDALWLEPVPIAPRPSLHYGAGWAYRAA